MAGLRKSKSGYYIARTHLPKGSHPSEVSTPLKTRDYKTALIRKIEVEKRSREIKAGLTVSFPWHNDEQELRIVHFSLEDAVKKYTASRKADRLAASTMNIIDNALDHFSRVLRPSFPIETIRLEQIDKFKVKAHEEEYASTTINIRLRNIKTFLLWLEDRNLIKKCPKIQMLSVPKQIRYLSDDQFNSILGKLEPLMQRALHFYRETGCRLSEPFFGEVNGNFLTITAEHAKGRRQRDIYLTSRLKDILLELRDSTHLKPTGNRDPSVLKIVRNTHEVKFYSRQFKRAATACKIDNVRFHDLRHTAALRMYLKTRDIYAVARLLGHSSVNTTQIYANFDLKRLEQDFPDLVQQHSVDEVRLSYVS